MASVPPDTDSLAHFPISGFFSNSVNHSSDFMAGNSWILNSWKGTLFSKRVAMTNSTSLDLYSYSPTSGRRNIFFNELKRLIRPCNLNSSHFCHKDFHSL